MTPYEAIEKRRSVREYRDKPIDEKTLSKILGAARMAPSAHNSQEYKFVVVKSASKRKEVSDAAMGQKFIAQAPVVIVAVSLNPDYTLESGVPTYALDAAIALDHITLAAVEEGLDTCWIGSFDQEKIRSALGVPNKCKVVALLTLGTAYDDPGVKTRKSVKELFCEDFFQET